MRIAHSYFRWSTARQGREGRDSYRLQLQKAKEWCQVNGYSLSEDTFIDAGKSGFKGEHLGPKGELRRFLDLVENGTIKPPVFLLIEEYSRFARLKPVASYKLFLDVIMSGVGLVFTMSHDQRIITAELLDKEPYLLQMILGECIRAYNESEIKSQKVKAAKQSKLLAIKNGSIVPHNNVPKYFTWNGSRYIHNEKTETVKRIVENYLEGNSLYFIACELNRKNVGSLKTAGKWNPRSVKCILQSRCLIGEFLENKTFLPPVVDTDTFNKVQLLLAQNTTNRGKPAELVNIFKSVAYCQCGARMNILNQSLDYRTKKEWKRTFRYFRCSSVSQGKPCQHRSCVPLDQIELEFFVECLMTDPRKLFGSPADAEIKALRQTILTHTENVKGLTAQINKLLELSVAMPMAEIKTKLSDLNQQREQQQTALDRAKMGLSRLETTPAQFNEIKAIVEEYRLADVFNDQEFDKATEKYAKTLEQVRSILRDNSVRNQLRVIMPRLIQKIVINSKDRSFQVFNQYGKCVHKTDGTFDIIASGLTA